MKVLHLTTIKELRGGDIQMYELIQNTSENSDVEHYVLTKTDSELYGMMKKQGINVYSSDCAVNFDIRYSIKIVHLVNRLNIDIIHIHDSTALTLTLVVSNLLKGKKIIYTRKSNNAIKQKALNIWKYNHRNIDLYTCVSNAVKDELLKVVRKKDRIITVYDGINLGNFTNQSSGILRKEYNIPDDYIIIGNISSLSLEKGLFTFIKTAEYLKNNSEQKFKFVIIGKGPLERELKNFAHSKNLQDDIIFTGFRCDVPKLIPEFNIMLITSEIEGLGVATLEAFASEVPAVSTKTGGLQESIIHNETGLSSETSDHEGLGKNILRLLSDNDLRNEIINNAKNILNQKFNVKMMADSYIKIYKSLLNKTSNS
ncbi:glycosyltransferase family 4 protein [Flavobacterium sp. '19STA2R22 D10 B1']|uniref:glycosyltransferase family 4 protein n=1 Tax=Flavobacterium aerium TaxID=3037261 RepID=UPI00278C817D|nr:glycosyltransferase family 4 protein [Flavobacterium sp. '19STA2R22 D10 B1']